MLERILSVFRRMAERYAEKRMWVPAAKVENPPRYMAGGYHGKPIFWAIDEAGRLWLYDEIRDSYAVTAPTLSDVSEWDRELQEYAGKGEQQ